MAPITGTTSQATPATLPPSVFTLPQTAQLEALYTIIRDRTTSRGDFLFYSDRIIRLLVEEGLNHLPVVPKTVETPTVRGHVFIFRDRVIHVHAGGLLIMTCFGHVGIQVRGSGV
jgi:uracil phosphoribosyltransferase